MTFAAHDDDTLRALREKRLAQLKREASLESQTYGALTPVSMEKEAVHIVAHTANLVIHFRMPTFRRCAIMSEHLTKLAGMYPKTRFIEVNADEMPFLTAKFKVQVLPCLVIVLMGQVVDKVVGFDDLGGSDNFETVILQRRLQICGAIPMPAKPRRHKDDDSDSDYD